MFGLSRRLLRRTFLRMPLSTSGSSPMASKVPALALAAARPFLRFAPAGGGWRRSDARRLRGSSEGKLCLFGRCWGGPPKAIMLGRAPWRLGLGRAGGGGGSKARLTLPTDEDGIIGGIAPAEALFLAVCAEVCAWLLAPEVPEVGAAQLTER